MKKSRKGIISLLIVLVLSLCSFPVTALDVPESEDEHNHDACIHEHYTEIAVNESEEIPTQASIAGIECLFGHDYKFNRQWQSGTLPYGSDSSYCYTIKERWIVEDKCTRCGATRELVAPGAILEQRMHTFVADQYIYIAGVLVSYRLTCSYCHHSFTVYL